MSSDTEIRWLPTAHGEQSPCGMLLVGGDICGLPAEYLARVALFGTTGRPGSVACYHACAPHRDPLAEAIRRVMTTWRRWDEHLATCKTSRWKSRPEEKRSRFQRARDAFNR